jgi:hypothetical protein
VISDAQQIRKEELGPASHRVELGHVLHAVIAVSISLLLYLSATVKHGKTQSNLLPFQALIETRSPAEQRVFRELQEGVLEAERVRSVSGAWPSVEALAADGIPPFATSPAPGAIYKWSLISSGYVWNYIGVPVKTEDPVWLITIQEPQPRDPPDPAREDEEHHRLATGMMLHVAIWNHPSGIESNAKLVRLPQAYGWTQLYGVMPGANLTPSS